MCVFVLLFCRVISTFLLPTSMNINDIKRGYIFTFWGRYFEGIVTCLCYEHTLLLFIIIIHARILSSLCINMFNLAYASFSWQIIFMFISSFVLYGAFAPCIHSSISNVINGYILFCFSLIPWKLGLKVFIPSYIMQMEQTFMEIVWY